jgi:hypothetical protein
VITDAAKPETEGKVFLYKFGKKIFNKISEKLEPEFADEKAFNPFDLWEGANFKLRIRNVEGYRNYDSSYFDPTSPLFDDDEKLETLWKSQFGLKEFVSPSNFKSYDELKEKLAKVLSEDLKTPSLYRNEETDEGKSLKTLEGSSNSRLESKSPAAMLPIEDEDGDGDLAYFQKLVG